MPGVITNPQMNPMQSYLEWTHGSPTAEADYQAGVSKGYKWTGAGWNYVGGGDPANWTQAMKNGAAQMNDPRWGAGGAPMSGASPGTSFGGGGSGTSMSGLFGTSTGTNPFDVSAQANFLRDDFRRMRERSGNAVNEDLAARGIFSGGVGAKIAGDARSQLDSQEAAALERLYGDSARQKMAFDMEQARFGLEQQRAMYGGGAQRFSSGDTGGNVNQGLMNFYSSKAQGDAADMGGGSGGNPYMAQQTGMTQDPRKLGAMGLASAYYKATGKYGTPLDQQAWASSIWDKNKVPFQPIG